MIIRRATQEDALALSSLCVDVQRLHAEHYPQLFKFPETEDFALAFFSEWLGYPTVVIFIAEDRGEACGYAVCRHIERPETAFTFPVRFLQIEHISVRPALQGKGTGAALMAEAESLARELGHPPDGAEVLGVQYWRAWFLRGLGFEKFNHLVLEATLAKGGRVFFLLPLCRR